MVYRLALFLSLIILPFTARSQEPINLEKIYEAATKLLAQELPDEYSRGIEMLGQLAARGHQQSLNQLLDLMEQRGSHPPVRSQAASQLKKALMRVRSSKVLIGASKSLIPIVGHARSEQFENDYATPAAEIVMGQLSGGVRISRGATENLVERVLNAILFTSNFNLRILLINILGHIDGNISVVQSLTELLDDQSKTNVISTSLAAAKSIGNVCQRSKIKYDPELLDHCKNALRRIADQTAGLKNLEFEHRSAIQKITDAFITPPLSVNEIMALFENPSENDLRLPIESRINGVLHDIERHPYKLDRASFYVILNRHRLQVIDNNESQGQK